MKSNKLKSMGWLVAVVFALGSFGAMAKPGVKMQVTGVVNLNQATEKQLDLLPGVGQKAARRIIEHRAKTPFTKLEDLRKVKGFGAKKFEKLKPFLTLSGPTTAALKKLEPGEKPAPSAQGRRGTPSGKR